MSVLQMIKGPHRGQIFELTEDESVIGRYPFCQVVLHSHTVSREHARIEFVDGEYYISDLGSLNGTFVNSERIRGRRKLADGDRIRIYEIVLLFHEAGAPAAKPHDSTIGMMPEATTEPQPKDAIQVLKLAGGTPTAAGAERRRLFLLRCGDALALTDVDRLLAEVLDALLELFPQTDSGHILLIGPDGELVLKASASRDDDSSAPLTIGPLSRGAKRRLLDSGEAILQEADDDEASESVLDTAVVSTISAPLVGPSRLPLGTVHLDTRSSENRFRREDLELLAFIANCIGHRVEWAQLLED